MTTDNQKFDQAVTELQAQTANLQSSYSEDRDMVNQLLGQAQMADAFAKFSVTVTTSKLAFVKENKLYKGLAGQKGGDGHQLSGTWEEFCKLLGRSREQVDEDIRNLKSLGEEALESMNKMGIGYREMRQFRKLPADQKEALISVAKEGDKDSFLELAEDIIAKHAKEKEALTAQLDDIKKDHEAQSAVIAKGSDELTKTKLELEKVSKRIHAMPESEAIVETQKEIGLQSQSGLSILVMLEKGFELLRELSESTGTDQRAYMHGELAKLEWKIDSLREEFALPKADELGAEDYLNSSLYEEVVSEFSNKDEEQFDYIEGAFIPTQEGGGNEDESGRH